jgi:hypothetical protein
VDRDGSFARIGLTMLPLVALASRAAIPFVRVPASYHAQCRVTAQRLGYAVPCPGRLPKALTVNQDGATPDCATTVICPIVSGPWRDWAAGSLSSPGQHLVLTASPRAIAADAHAVDGPAWAPNAHVRPIGWVTTGRWRMRAVFVSPRTNEGAFVNHVALVWTVGAHTYAVGFHDFTGLAAALRLDRRLAASIELVRP